MNTAPHYPAAPLINRRLQKRHFLILSIFFVCFWNSCKTDELASSLQEAKLPSIFDQLVVEDVLRLQLVTDFSKLLDKDRDETSQAAQLTVLNGVLSGSTFPIKISKRGETRKRYCAFPPLRLRFKKDSLATMGLAKIRAMKLVTHCMADSLSERYLLREFVTYKLYNLLSDYSFRVQLAKIDYIDSIQWDTTHRYAFLIEPAKQLEQRLDCQLLSDEHPSGNSIHKAYYNLLTVFQYMIGNTDWNIRQQHNIKMFASDIHPAPIPIPYDFDYAGLVNASYARPHPKLALQNVRQRMFQWRGKNAEELHEVLEQFLDKKDILLDYCQTVEHLHPTCKQDQLAYLQSFFDIIESEDDRLHILLGDR